MRTGLQSPWGYLPAKPLFNQRERRIHACVSEYSSTREPSKPCITPVSARRIDVNRMASCLATGMPGSLARRQRWAPAGSAPVLAGALAPGDPACCRCTRARKAGLRHRCYTRSQYATGSGPVIHNRRNLWHDALWDTPPRVLERAGGETCNTPWY